MLLYIESNTSVEKKIEIDLELRYSTFLELLKEISADTKAQYTFIKKIAKKMHVASPVLQGQSSHIQLAAETVTDLKRLSFFQIY